MRNVFLLFAFSLAAASAQSLSVGVLGGAPFTDVVNGDTVNGVQSIAKSTNFTIGPALQVNLPAGLRFEVDALFRPYKFSLGASSFLLGPTNITALQWRFPLLVQYRFGPPIVKPFVEAGVSVDHLSGISSVVKSVASGPGQLLHSSDAGIVLGAGLDVKVPFVRVSGEFRYTRQAVSNFADISNKNQAEVLIGLHF